ncbi:hypothetical protein F2P56_015081, partial [Juglans regia]
GYTSLNVGNFITLRLTPNNYPLWREQALALAESQELVGHLTNEDPAPNKYIIPSNSTNVDNTIPQLTDAFIAWRKSDCLLRGWIIGTLSEEALKLIVGLDTAHAVWEALNNAYAQESQEREFTLRQQLTYLRKKDHTSITEHICTFKGYRRSTQKFTSTGHGFQAQQSKDSSQAYNSSPTSAQCQPPPPGERCMTPSEREKYRDQQCQYCGMMGQIAKIC